MKLFYEKKLLDAPIGREEYLRIYKENDSFEIKHYDESTKNTITKKCNINDLWDQTRKIILLRENPYYSDDCYKIADEVKKKLEDLNSPQETLGSKILFNEEDVRRFYQFFKHKHPTEIRVFDPIKYPKGKSIFVNTEDEFVEKCRYYSQVDKISAYIGARDKTAMGDKNVTSSHFVLFEIDEHDGKDKTEERDKIINYLKKHNIQISMQGMSGGGWHFYIPHKLQEFENSDKAFEYKGSSLAAMKKILQGQGFDIDGAIFNLERVMRVLGTFNYKRDKISRIDYINNNIDINANTKALNELILSNPVGINKDKEKVTVTYNADDDELIKQIKEKWIDGDRNNLALCVSGYLRKEKRLGLTTALQIIEKICDDCEDNFAERRAAVEETYKKDEKDIKGIKGLVEREINPNKTNLPMVRIGGSGLLASEISNNIANQYSSKKILFYKQETKGIVEVSNIKHDSGDNSFLGFSVMKPKRFITLSEKYFVPYMNNFKTDRQGNQYVVETPTSLTNEKSSIVLESPQFQDAMPAIKRIFTVQTPIIYNDKLTFPNEEYDERFFSWLPKHSPIIEDMNMPLKDAKEIILNIFKEFCFETKQDYTNAVSALLTPFLQGLFKTGFSTRTPVYCYEANRERSGKDYLAGVTGILYEGYALEEPPISNGEYRSSGSNDELKKKLLAAMISGRRRLHFSNNKGHLNNSVFESIITAMKFSDRLLGKNEIVTLDNELSFSFSGNLGITLTPDLSNRTVFINLFLDIEDANKRKFKNPNLHGWVLENRNSILSALYSLVKNWFDKKCPDGSVLFTSFPEWARVCGGIMEAAGYDSPCKKSIQNTGVSIDRDTDEMKELFEICHRDAPDIWLNKNEIKAIICKPGESIMSYIDWSSRSSQIKFGIKLNKFVGRLLSDIRLLVEDNSIRSARWRYKFTKIAEKNEKLEIFS